MGQVKAPEKIYFDGESKACKLPIFSSQNIEYTRTDAFIERAWNWLELNLSDRPKENIKFWLEDFKNYMEGE